MPAIKESVKQSQDAFSKVDMNKFTKKVQQAVTVVKKRMEILKQSNRNNEIKLTINNKEAQKQISQIQKQIEALQEKINARQMKLNIITPKLDKITTETTKAVTPEGINSDNPAIQNTINNSLSKNKDYSKLAGEEEKLVQEIAQYNKELDVAKSKMSQLRRETNETATSQSKSTSFFSAFKQKTEQVKPNLDGIKNIFNQIPKITQKITNHIKRMGTGLKQGIGHVLKYAGALFSLKGIYSVLSNSAQSWLSSQNAGAKQLSANIEYMKYAMGSAFAPIIQYVINLIYELMKAIQSVVYALFKINIFSEASAKNYASMASNAKKAKKALDIADFDEVHNIKNTGSESTSPNIDLSGVDSQMSPLAQKLYDFFKPLVDSWNKYGQGLVEQVKTTAGQIGYLISSIWGSFEKIITNGTVYSILQNILAIIGNIAQAWANAWNYNNNGDVIVQNLANAFNNLLIAINNVVSSPEFQAWLKECSNKFREISEKIASIDWQPLVDALFEIGQSIGTLALDILSGLVDVFKWLAENPIVAEIILAIAIAIGVVSTVLGIVSSVLAVLNPILQVTNITLMPLIGIIAGIIVGLVALIAVVILVIQNWEWLSQKASEIFTAIGDFFKNLWQGICDTATNVWNGICDFFKGIWDWIANLASSIWNGIIDTISNIINNIKATISGVLNAIKTVWNNIWNGIKNTVVNIWNGIWGAIKGVINFILGGIESFVNGVIKGINFLLKGISNVANAIGSLIGLGPINLELKTISLPRLAKGGVLTEATTVIAGEYSGAKSNPEIVTPQNIMYDTVKRALKDVGNRSQDTINLTNELKVNGKTIAREIIQDLNGEAQRLGYKPILQRG